MIRFLPLLFLYSASVYAQTDTELRSLVTNSILLEEPHTALFYLNKVKTKQALDDLLTYEAKLQQGIQDSSVASVPSDLIGYRFYLMASRAYLVKDFNSTLKILKGHSKISKQPMLAAKVAFLKAKAWIDLVVPDSARQYLIASINLFRRDSVSSYIQIAKVHNFLGRMYDQLSQQESAIKHYKSSLAIFQNTPLEKWDDHGKVLNNLAVAYDNLGDYSLAERNYLAAIQIKEKHSTNNSNIATTYSNLASFYSDYGNNLKSKAMYDKTRALIDSTQTTTFSLLADFNNNYGVLLMNMREFEAGAKKLRLSLFYHSKLSSLSQLTIRPTLNLITCLYSTGDSVTAKRMLRTLQDSVNQLNHPSFERAIFYRIKADVLMASQVDSAFSSYDQAKRELEYLSKTNLPIYTDVLSGLGQVAVIKRQYAEAKRYYNLSVLRVIDNPFEKVKCVLLFNNLGKIYLNENRIDSAVLYFRKSLQENNIKNEQSIPDVTILANPFEFIVSHFGLAQHYFNDYQGSKSPESLRQALLSIQSSLTLIVNEHNRMASENDKIKWNKDLISFFDLAIQVRYENFLVHKTAESYELLFQVIEQARLQTLLNALKLDKISAFAGVTREFMSLEQRQANKAKHLATQLSDELTLGEQANADLINEYVNGLKELEIDKSRMLDSIKERLPDYYNIKYNKTVVSSVDLRKNVLEMNSNAMVIQFQVANNDLFVLLQHSNMQWVFRKPYHEVAMWITNLRNTIKYQLPDWKTPASRLNTLLLKSADSLISRLPIKITSLIIIPDGELHLLPFETLYNDSKKQVLVERFKISYASSATLLWQKFTDTFRPRQGRQYFVGLAPSFEGYSIANNTYRQSTAGAFVFDALPEAPTEIRSIEKQLNQINVACDVLEGSSASEQSFKRIDLSAYSYIHLATHGFLNKGLADKSGVAFAVLPEENEDGILFSDEVYNLKLQAELVTLSACETGLGRYQRGEGLIGLSRGFLYAGAQNLLVSLWSVQDKSTAEWMVNFYTNFARGVAIPQSVQKAKLKFIRSRNYSHPYYWAPFILISG